MEIHQGGFHFALVFSKVTCKEVNYLGGGILPKESYSLINSLILNDLLVIKRILKLMYIRA